MDLSVLRAAEMKRDTLTIVSKSGEHKFNIEIAETPAQKALGLMYRETLAPLAGMLFPHKTPQELSMWMQNTYISLDMIFIRQDGTIHRIEHSTEPFTEDHIMSQGKVLAVLEVKGGEARRLGLAKGDKVRHSLFSK